MVENEFSIFTNEELDALLETTLIISKTFPATREEITSYICSEASRLKYGAYPPSPGSDFWIDMMPGKFTVNFSKVLDAKDVEKAIASRFFKESYKFSITPDSARTSCIVVLHARENMRLVLLKELMKQHPGEITLGVEPSTLMRFMGLNYQAQKGTCPARTKAFNEDVARALESLDDDALLADAARIRQFKNNFEYNLKEGERNLANLKKMVESSPPGSGGIIKITREEQIPDLEYKIASLKRQLEIASIPILDELAILVASRTNAKMDLLKEINRLGLSIKEGNASLQKQDETEIETVKGFFYTDKDRLEGKTKLERYFEDQIDEQKAKIKLDDQPGKRRILAETEMQLEHARQEYKKEEFKSKIIELKKEIELVDIKLRPYTNEIKNLTEQKSSFLAIYARLQSIEKNESSLREKEALRRRIVKWLAMHEQLHEIAT